MLPAPHPGGGAGSTRPAGSHAGLYPTHEEQWALRLRFTGRISDRRCRCRGQSTATHWGVAVGRAHGAHVRADVDGQSGRPDLGRGEVMTYQLNLLCGCTIDYERGRMLDARGVTFCPLHAAAPLMLDALKPYTVRKKAPKKPAYDTARYDMLGLDAI